MAAKAPKIDLICNIVVRRADGRVLLEPNRPDDGRWWIPAHVLVPYEHPEVAAPKVLAGLRGLKSASVALVEIESFRGRSGWHVMFNYRVDVKGALKKNSGHAWFAPDALPQMVHGPWERGVIGRAVTAKRK